MHINHRRKNRYKHDRPRNWTRLAPYKELYWKKERARVRHLMENERYEDLRDKIYRTILWDIW